MGVAGSSDEPERRNCPGAVKRPGRGHARGRGSSSGKKDWRRQKAHCDERVNMSSESHHAPPEVEARADRSAVEATELGTAAGEATEPGTADLETTADAAGEATEPGTAAGVEVGNQQEGHWWTPGADADEGGSSPNSNSKPGGTRRRWERLTEPAKAKSKCSSARGTLGERVHENSGGKDLEPLQ